jgi:sugar phosphate isomerase/epimerase
VGRAHPEVIPAFHYTLGLGREDWRQQIDLARAAGFRAVDVDLRSAATMEPGAMLDALGELRAASGRLPAYPGGQLDPRIPGFCLAIGLSTLTCSVPPSLDAPADLLPQYREWAAMLAGAGLSLAIEALTPLHLRFAKPYAYVQSFAAYREFVAAVGENAGFLLDSWHWHHGGYPSPRGLRVLHVHLADAARVAPEAVRDEEREFPGEGVINLAGLLGEIGGYTGYVSAEVFGQQGRFADGLSRARFGRESVEAVLRQVVSRSQ